MPDIDERANIAGLQLVDPDGLHDSRGDLLLVERYLHHADMGGIEQPIDMFLQPKNRGTGLSLVAAKPLKCAQSIMQRMGHHVDMRVRPIDERPIHPNFPLWLKHRQRRQACK